MSSPVSPPSSDEIIQRHQFYSTVAGNVNNTSKEIDEVSSQLDDFTKEFESVRDDVKTSNVRNKTLISVAVVIWTVLGGLGGAYLKSSFTSYDKNITKLEQMDKHFEQNKDVPEKIEAIKKSMIDLEKRLKDLENRIK